MPGDDGSHRAGDLRALLMASDMCNGEVSPQRCARLYTPDLAAARRSPDRRSMRPERFRRLAQVLARRQPDLTVLMEKVNKSHNFSAILRNCDAVGVLEAHAVPPASRAGAASRHVRGHAQVDPRTPARQRARRPSPTCEEAGFHVLAAHPGEGARDYREVDLTRPTAIMMGAELHGVSEEGLALAHAHVALPMMGMVHSLNVSVATALLLYEAMRQREAAGMYDDGPRLEPGRVSAVRSSNGPTPSWRIDIAGRDARTPTLDEDGTILGA